MAAEKTDFAGIFFTNEYRELAGNRNVVIRRLTMLFVLTFLALGFAIGGRLQLKQRMDSPFTNWVDVYVNNSIVDQLDDMEKFLDQGNTMETYGLEPNGRTEWNRYFATFLQRSFNPVEPVEKAAAYQRYGRTIDFGGDLFQEIIKPGSTNLIYRNEAAFSEDIPQSCGIVVTKDLVKKLGYQRKDFATLKFLPLELTVGNDDGSTTDYVTFVELIAVVEQLPSQVDFITSNRLYYRLQRQKNDEGVERSNNDGYLLLLAEKSGQSQVLTDQLKQRYGSETNYGRVQERAIQLDQERTIYGYYFNYRSLTPDQLASWRKNLKVGGLFQDYADFACSDDVDDLQSQHNLTFRFADLKGIRPFYEDMKEKFGIELSMEQVESRENFRLVARLTSLLGGILAIFGLLSILLYLWNLVRGHVNKIKPNLGTLKAMGLPNQRLLSIYARVLLKLLAVSIAIGLPVALLIGWGLDQSLLHVGFQLLDWTIPFAILLIVGVVIYLVSQNLKTVLSATPGDLIYERE